jgi:NAD-dependent SIR2 family protein deacetylase
VSEESEPTAFHKLVKRLDERGTLVRVYTQNIDGLEEKAGVSTYHRTRQEEVPQAGRFRCIPVHGSLRYLYCPSCQAVEDQKDHKDELMQGIFPDCGSCSKRQERRIEEGKRVLGVSQLIPDVVLYDQVHPDGQHILEFLTEDLSGAWSIDLLLVVGTGMHVIGTQRMIREFAQQVQQNQGNSDNGPCVIYLNRNFPQQRKWESTFDVWVEADCQLVANTLLHEMEEDEVKRQGQMKRKRKIHFPDHACSDKDEVEWYLDKKDRSETDRDLNYFRAGNSKHTLGQRIPTR